MTFDQTLMRHGLKTILELELDFRIVGEVSDGQAAVEQVLKSRPDIVLMDVQMPRLNGVEATAAICQSWPGARIIILITIEAQDSCLSSRWFSYGPPPTAQRPTTEKPARQQPAVPVNNPDQRPAFGIAPTYIKALDNDLNKYFYYG
jgi:chemotaxis response regulator CheB